MKNVILTIRPGEVTRVSDKDLVDLKRMGLIEEVLEEPVETPEPQKKIKNRTYNRKTPPETPSAENPGESLS